MGFAGELTTIGLPEVFQNVAFNRLTGVLAVRERERQVALLIEEGKIRAFRTGGEERAFDYEALAERSGAIDPAVAANTRKRRRRLTLLRALRREEGFDEARFAAAVRERIEEEVISLFAWREASFVFEEGRPGAGEFDPEQTGLSIAIDAMALAMEAARRLDEWESISRHISSEREIFLATPGANGAEVPPGTEEILALLDGTRDVRALLAELPQSRFHVMKAIAALAGAGLVERATAEHLRELARRAGAAGEIHRAAGYLESALEREAGDLESRRELVRLFERGGRKNDAARELKRLAYAHEELGDLDAAKEAYERAAVLVPYDTDTLERIVAIHDGRGDKSEFMKAGRRLAEAFASQGMQEEALEVYQRLLARDEESYALREALAATYVKLHEPKQAARELLVLARRAWGRNSWEKALDYYRNVLAVDRECAEATDRVAEIESGRVRQLRMRRRRRIALAAGSVVLGLLGWQFSREWYAQDALAAAARAGTCGLAQDPSDESLILTLGNHAAVALDFPWTRAAGHAEETAGALLMEQLQRIQMTLARKPDLAEGRLRRLAEVKLPESLSDLWRSERDRLLVEIANRRSGDVTPGEGR